VTITTRNAKQLHACPWCYNHPPATHKGDITDGMLCFSCTHSGCPLAQEPDVAVFDCRCGKPMVLRKWPSGEYYIGCKNYPACAEKSKLPRAFKSVEVLETKCTRCRRGYMCKVSLDPRKVPPTYEMQFKACLRPGCDDYTNELLHEDGPRGGGSNGRAQASRPAPQQQQFRQNNDANAQRSAQQARAVPQQAQPVRQNSAQQARAVPQQAQPVRQNSMPSSAGWQSYGPGAVRQAQTSTAGSEIKCKCGVPAKELTSRKETSAGRQFFTCGRDRHCEFFQWNDEGPQSGGQQAMNNSNNSNGNLTCFKCGKPGHFANNCPDAGGNSRQSETTNAGNVTKCFRCGDVGHLANNCPGNSFAQKRSNNGSASESKRTKVVKRCKQCGEEMPHAKNSTCSSLKRNQG